MAGYNVDIQVNANTRAAERALDKLVQQTKKLQNIDIGGPSKGARRAAEAFVPQKQLNALDKALKTITGRVNTFEKAFARIVEGVGTFQVLSAGAQGANEALKALSVATGNSAANFSGAANKIDEFAASGDNLRTVLAQVNNLLTDIGHEVTRATVPGFAAMDDTAQAVASQVNRLQYAFQQFLDVTQPIREVAGSFGTLEGASGAVAAGFAVLAGIAETNLLQALKDIDATGSAALKGLADDAAKGASELQRLIRSTQGTVEQYEALIARGRERLRLVNAESDEARRAANTITQGQKLLNTELDRQNDLLREARGLRSASVENRATNTFNVTQGRKSYEKTVADEMLAVRQSIRSIAQQPTDFTRALGIDSAEEKLRRFNREMDELHAALGAMEGRAANPFGISAEQMDRAAHNARHYKGVVEQVNAELQEMVQVHQALGRMEGRAANPFGISQEQVSEVSQIRMQEETAFADFKMQTIRQAIDMELDGIETVFKAQMAADKAAMAAFDKELARRTESKKQGRTRLENILIGGAFPLLFGGGPGAVLGGAGGGAIQGSNPMISIFTSAIGMQLDEFVRQTAELGKALVPATANIQTLIETLGKTSESAKYIEFLEREFGTKSALSAAQEEMNRLVGQDGVGALQKFGGAMTQFEEGVARFAAQVQAIVASIANSINESPLNPLRGGIGEAGLRRQAAVSQDPRMVALIARREEARGGLTGFEQADLDRQVLELQKKINEEEQKKLETKRLSLQITRNEIIASNATVESSRLDLEIAKLGSDIENDKVRSLMRQKAEMKAIAEQQQILNDLRKDDADFLLIINRLQDVQNRYQRELADIENSLNKAREKGKKDRESRIPFLRNEIAMKKVQNVFEEGSRKAAAADNDIGVVRIKQAMGLLALKKQAADIRANTEIPGAEKELMLESLKLDKVRLNLEAQYAIAELERQANERREAATGDVKNDINLIAARIQGREQEFRIQQEIDQLIKDGEEPAMAENLIRSKYELLAIDKERIRQQELLNNLINTSGQQFTSLIETLITGTNNWNSALRNVLTSLSSALLRYGLQAIGDAGDPEGQGIGLFSILSGTFGKRANGGSVSSGKPYMVGERGPEMFIPGAQGNIVPNHGMGGSNIVVNVDAGGTQVQGDAPNASKLGEALGAAVRAELMRQKRPGGLLA